MPVSFVSSIRPEARTSAVRSRWLPFFTIEELHQQEDLLDRVLELVVLLNDDMTQAIAALGLTPSRTHLLWELGQRGPVTQQVLATALKITPRAVTGLVDALVGSGLVTREPHPTDRRATLVTLTSRAEALVSQLKRDHEALASSLFAPMARTEFDSFARGLDGVIVRLRTHLAATALESQRAKP
jgi:DNA-binding MarR family transcriptional regulator